MNNCFSTNFRGEYEQLEENLAKREKQMWLSLAIMPRNPSVTARAVIIMQNSYNTPLKIILKCNFPVIENNVTFILKYFYKPVSHKLSSSPKLIRVCPRLCRRQTIFNRPV